MHFPLLFNKKSVIIPDKKGIVGSGFVKRHHMIGYSIVSDKSSCTGDIKLNLYQQNQSEAEYFIYLNIKALKGKIFSATSP